MGTFGHRAQGWSSQYEVFASREREEIGEIGFAAAELPDRRLASRKIVSRGKPIGQATHVEPFVFAYLDQIVHGERGYLLRAGSV